MKVVVSRPSEVSSQHIIGTGSAPALPNFRQKLKRQNRNCFTWCRCVLLFLSTVCFASMANAQPDSSSTYKTPPVDMAGIMRSNGKIYVVVAVLVFILIGLFFYLTRLDRKITRLEKGTWKDT